jgi:hypothetical protein
MASDTGSFSVASFSRKEATGEVIARTTIEPHSQAVLPGDNPKAVMLDLVQPLAAGGQLIGFGWKARRDETGREGTATCGQEGAEIIPRGG